MKVIPIIFISFVLCIAACAPKIYQAPDFARTSRKHKSIAILPADISLKLRPNQAKKFTLDQISEEEEKTGFEIQRAMYTWFLKRSGQLNYTIKFQDIIKTNSLLKEANIEYEDIKTKDRAFISKLLGVDAVLQNSTVLDKPMSEGAAVALGILLGTWGSTNRATTSISIHEGDQGELMWKYDYLASGSVGSSTDQLVNVLMRNASRKFPYKQDK